MVVPDTSVIVCCYTFDRLEDTLAAIASVLRQSVTPHEMIVSVDNNPPLADELRKLLASDALIAQNDGLWGEAETRNVGVANATGEIIAFLDDDAVAEPDWLEKLLMLFDDPHVMAASGQSAPSWETGHAPPWFPREFDFVVGCTGHKDLMLTDTMEIRNVVGSNMLFRRSVFSQLGGWQRQLGRGQVKTGGAEAEMCLRLKSEIPEALILYEPRAVVHHKVAAERATLKYVFTYAFHEGGVRAKLRQHASRHTTEPLAGEHLYLRRLLDTALPARLKRLYRPASAAQLAVMLANIALVGVGYAGGRLRHR